MKLLLGIIIGALLFGSNQTQAVDPHIVLVERHYETEICTGDDIGIETRLTIEDVEGML